MSLLHFHPDYYVVICTSCQYALQTTTLSGILTHLMRFHKEHSPAERKAMAADVPTALLASPDQVKHFQLPPTLPPTPQLATFTDGIACKLCPADQIYICRQNVEKLKPCKKKQRDQDTVFAKDAMIAHLGAVHGWRRKQGGLTREERGRLMTVITFPIACQTFYRGDSRRYFQVGQGVFFPSLSLPLLAQAQVEEPPLPSLQDQCEERLAQKIQEAAQSRNVERHTKQVSPWLDQAGWETYLQPYNHVELLPLLDPPDLSNSDDYILLLLWASFDRIIEAARESIESDKINIFDLHIANSFHKRKTNQFTLRYKLQETTYDKYRAVWKRLLCFIYRRVWCNAGPELSYRLTEAQKAGLEDSIQAAAALAVHYRTRSRCLDTSTAASKQHERDLDANLLKLCIALMDHALYSSIYESIIVVFFAVLGLKRAETSDGQEQIHFHHASTYTPNLSAFIKLAQLLVIQRSVLAVDWGETLYTADMLKVLQERFIVYGQYSPVNWAQKLRSIGKGIVQISTAIGYISWSDDGEHVSYKELELGMSPLKDFLVQQVKTAQAILYEDLLFLNESLISLPSIDLRRIKDNPANSTPGWSFLDDPRNLHLWGYDRWMFKRIFNETKLQQHFLYRGRGNTSDWKHKAVTDYLAKVIRLLEKLALLIHVLGGQPARGTELFTLQLQNSLGGLLRGFFIENGLGSFVTDYHKGYSISGSVKIIHRYLPAAITELLIYYMMLVKPLCDQLEMLVLEKPQPEPTFLWVVEKEGKNMPWPSPRLTDVLAREFRQHLNTKVNILLWRHTAIAISRRHLGQHKFRKDYGLEHLTKLTTWGDMQTAHPGPCAGQVYARGLEEAPGHVASAKAEYRQISIEWHRFLGVAEIEGWVRATVEPKPLVEAPQKVNVAVKRVGVWESDGVEGSGDQFWFKRRRLNSQGLREGLENM